MFIKVCGITNQENLSMLQEVGVDRVGFIFYSKSARSLHERLESTKLCRTGVFVNESFQGIRKQILLNSIDAVQLHGDESPTFCKLIKSLGVEVSKAVPVGEELLTNVYEYEGYVDHLLFDTKGEKRGGNGVRFNWDLLDYYKGTTPVILSGGITPDHAEDIRMVRERYAFVAGVDLNTGFEVSPGIKDVELIKEFINQLKDES